MTSYPVEEAIRRFALTPGQLSHNPIFKLAINGFDALPKLFFKRYFASLPPAHMRLRVGVGREVLNNHITHLHGVRIFWIYVLSKGYMNMESSILDVGCGCGRYAQYLRDYEMYEDSFRGRYIGIDIDAELLQWCRQNFDSRFSFHLSTERARKDAHEPYVPYKLPIPDSSVDLVFSTSLYTHLLAEEMAYHTNEAYRVLRPGGHVLATFFSYDHQPGRGITFKHSVGEAFVEYIDRGVHTNVAYREEFIKDVFASAGFKNIGIERGGQSMITAQK
jgi:SAM-dependent methyltransferase